MLANFSTTADVLCRIPSVKPGSIFLVVASTFETFYKPIVRFLTSRTQLAQHCHRKIIYLPNVKSYRHENEQIFLKFGSIQIIFFANSNTAISLLPPDGCKTRTTICSGFTIIITIMQMQAQVKRVHQFLLIIVCLFISVSTIHQILIKQN
ncbi:hypothetical protein D917_07217 [Trichinella nativa]|uniref:Uncharacterized protein n=1 Tax=Trichinella nativa TaxID=6335 RepID=A0A1Y3EQN2_9BILA|nr:hypothetical protein D917_07217 [Trichinella nativa]